MLNTLLIGILLVALTVAVHAFGTTYWINHLLKIQSRLPSKIGPLAEIRLLTATATIILLLVMMEIMIWAVAYMLLPGQESLQSMEEIVYFSAVTFTALGYGDIVLTGPWRLLSAIEAVAGLLIFGWSTAVLFAVVQNIWRARNYTPWQPRNAERSWVDAMAFGRLWPCGVCATGRAVDQEGNFMNQNGKVVVGLGEVLWDVFPTGPRFGGAPANFACSAAGLAGTNLNVYLVSGVGNDDLGRQALATLQAHGVNTTHVSQLAEPTGKVDIELDENGNASYDFAANTAWDSLAWNSGLKQLAGQADAVCFGTLGQRNSASRDTIQNFVAATPADCLRVFDINLRPPFYDFDNIKTSLELASVLKLNEHELGILAEKMGLSGSKSNQLTELAKRYALQCVALTLGSEGSLLVRGEEKSQVSVAETEVIDTVGAGDAFTATLTLGLLAHRPLDDINRHASKVAAFVCSQNGATPDFPPELQGLGS